MYRRHSFAYLHDYFSFSFNYLAMKDYDSVLRSLGRRSKPDDERNRQKADFACLLVCSVSYIFHVWSTFCSIVSPKKRSWRSRGQRHARHPGQLVSRAGGSNRATKATESKSGLLPGSSLVQEKNVRKRCCSRVSTPINTLLFYAAQPIGTRSTFLPRMH